MTDSFAFGTKAETLRALAPSVRESQVPEFDFFSCGAWEADRDGILARIAALFENTEVAVRSSAVGEDGPESAMAGNFHSVLHMPAADRTALSGAIDAVIYSYRQKNSVNPDNQVLVQKMVGPVAMSGVLFTQDLNSGAPYYVINYDDLSGRTDTVTAGDSYSNRTLHVHRGARHKLRSDRFRQLIQAVEEIERITAYDALDIEFAVGPDLTVYILQVRKITTKRNWNRRISLAVDESISQIQAFARTRFGPAPSVLGRRSIFSQMADWNPAEMLGRAPRPLAHSLYHHLITDQAWRHARKEMGYMVPKGQPLMVSLGGLPYIDVRLSFQSFLPASLPRAVGEKLVDAWLDRLQEAPHLHDKVEFDIAITAYDFAFNDRIAETLGDRLSPEETEIFRSHIKNLTRKLLTGERASILSTLARLEALYEERPVWPEDGKDDLSLVNWLLEDCIEHGTVPFSIVARHGFIAQSLMRSLVHRGVIDQTQCDDFFQSIRTVASDLAEDMNRLASGDLRQEKFMEQYGHLRPGTYDLLSPRYDQR